MSEEKGTRTIPINTKTTEEDLPQIKLLNTKAQGGQVNSTNGNPLINDLVSKSGNSLIGGTTLGVEDLVFDDYISGQRDYDTRHMTFWTIMSVYKAWHLSKFKYENLPTELDPLLFETYNWEYGGFMVFKFKNKFIFTHYEVQTWNIYGEPKVVTPLNVWATGDNPSRFGKKTNGVNCIVFHHSNSGFRNNIHSFGDLWKLWDSVRAAAQEFNTIKGHSLLTTQKIFIGDDVDNVKAEALLKALRAGPPVIKFDIKSISKNLQGNEKDNLFIDWEHIGSKYWEMYYHYLDKASLDVGQKHDPNPSKKERKNTTETNMNSHRTNSHVRTQLLYRKRDWDAFNKLFGTSVSVDFDIDFIKETMDDPMEENEGAENNKGSEE